jgi:peptidoglycan/LPS O-acetylase OafA/YrhL
MTSPKQDSTAGPWSFRFSENNFDLVRLVAAGEVAVRHSMHFLAPAALTDVVLGLLALVPGVPVFFFLSGYLISRSLERSTSIRDYLRNRALRLFPALWACIGVSLAFLFLTGYLSTVDWNASRLGTWIMCQATVLQFWNPEFLRKFGTGVVNGSLWSVSVEIQFYIVILIVYRALRHLPQAQLTVALVLVALAFGPLNAFKAEIGSMLDAEFGTTLGSKLYRASFIPWFYLFMLGVVAQRCAAWVVPLVRDRCPLVVVIYASCMLIDYSVWGIPLGNEIPAYLVPIMGITVLALAYRRPLLGERVLGGSDLSYGFYVYHMPLINLVMYLGAPQSLLSCFASLVGALALAALSWRFVERPFLRRKRGSLRAVAARP